MEGIETRAAMLPDPPLPAPPEAAAPQEERLQSEKEAAIVVEKEENGAKEAKAPEPERKSRKFKLSLVKKTAPAVPAVPEATLPEVDTMDIDPPTKLDIEIKQVEALEMDLDKVEKKQAAVEKDDPSRALLVESSRKEDTEGDKETIPKNVSSEKKALPLSTNGSLGKRQRQSSSPPEKPPLGVQEDDRNGVTGAKTKFESIITPQEQSTALNGAPISTSAPATDPVSPARPTAGGTGTTTDIPSKTAHTSTASLSPNKSGGTLAKANIVSKGMANTSPMKSARQQQVVSKNIPVPFTAKVPSRRGSDAKTSPTQPKGDGGGGRGTAGGGKDGIGDLRRQRSLLQIQSNGRPPVAPRPQPWELMLRDNEGAFAR